jgi:hypothetical protein
VLLLLNMLLGSGYLLVVVSPVLLIHLYLTQTLIRINVSAGDFLAMS